MTTELLKPFKRVPLENGALVGLTLWKIDAVSMNNLHKATKVNTVSQDENSNIQASSPLYRL